MCDNNDNLEECCKKVTKSSDRSSECGKCKNKNGKPSVYIRRDDPPLCQQCLIENTIHKIKSVFGKANIIKDNECVSVGFSGGLNSLVLVHLIHVINESQKKLRFTPFIISLYRNAKEKENLSKILSRYNFEYILEEYNDVFENSNQFRRIFIRKRLASIARARDYKYLLTGETAGRLSQLYLAGISQGRGANLNNDMTFIDERHGKPTILRPMNSFLPTQMAFYYYFAIFKTIGNDFSLINQLPPSKIENIYEDLTGSFVTEMQFGGFPSTILNIFKISDKLELKNVTENISTCDICLTGFIKNEIDDIQCLGKKALAFSDSLKGLKNKSFDSQRLKERQLCYPCYRMLSEYTPERINTCLEVFSFPATS